MEDFCFCGSGKRKNKCHPNVNPDSVVGSTIKLYSSWDKYLLSEKKNKNIRFICEDKCNHCCNNYFYISEKEYLSIYYHLKTTYDNSYIRTKIQLAKEYMNFIKENFPEEHKKIDTVIPPSRNGDIKEFYNDDLRRDQVYSCIFLNQKTGLCDVYPVRPIICRLHGVAYPFSACNKIIQNPDHRSKMVSLNDFPDKEDIYWLNFFKKSEVLPNIFRRSYPIAEWFATILPAQIYSNDIFLDYAITHTEEEYQKAICIRNKLI